VVVYVETTVEPDRYDVWVETTVAVGTSLSVAVTVVLTYDTTVMVDAGPGTWEAEV